MLYGPVSGVVHTRRAGWKLAYRWAAGLMLHSLADLDDVVPMRGHALVLADDLLSIGKPKLATCATTSGCLTVRQQNPRGIVASHKCRALVDFAVHNVFTAPLCSSNMRCVGVLAEALRTIASRHTVQCAKSDWCWRCSGDTRPCDALVDAAADATLLIHEATFEDPTSEADWREVRTRIPLVNGPCALGAAHWPIRGAACAEMQGLP